MFVFCFVLQHFLMTQVSTLLRSVLNWWKQEVFLLCKMSIIMIELIL